MGIMIPKGFVYLAEKALNTQGRGDNIRSHTRGRREEVRVVIITDARFLVVDC